MGLRVPISYASATVQDLEFTEKQLGLGVKVTYIDDAVAGSERVHRTNDREIRVHIASGVTTAARVKTLVEQSEANELVSIEVLGDEENPQVTGGAAVSASGTITLDAPELDDAVTVDGSTFTKDTTAEIKPFNKIYFNVPVEDDEINVGGFTAIYKASPTQPYEFSTAAQLAARIQATADSGFTTATVRNGVITVRSTRAGIDASAEGFFVLGPSNVGTMAIAGSRLEAGRNAQPLGPGKFEVAADLVDLINEVPEVEAVADGDVVTVTAVTPGVAGNAIALGVAGVGVAASGAALEGGADGNAVEEVPTDGAFSPSGVAFAMSSNERTIKDTFFEYQFGFKPGSLSIVNTDVGGTNDLVVSFDGTNVAATLLPGESYVRTEGNIPHCVQLKYTVGAPAYTIEATQTGPLLCEPTGTEAD